MEKLAGRNISGRLKERKEREGRAGLSGRGGGGGGVGWGGEGRRREGGREGGMQ